MLQMQKLPAKQRFSRDGLEIVYGSYHDLAELVNDRRLIDIINIETQWHRRSHIYCGKNYDLELYYYELRRRFFYYRRIFHIEIWLFVGGVFSTSNVNCVT
jgi:hypothetical protein